MCVCVYRERERERRRKRGVGFSGDVNGIESAREERQKEGRMTAQINLPLDFNNRIERSRQTQQQQQRFGEVCVCLFCCFIFIFGERKGTADRQEELKEEEKRGDR